MPNSHCTHFVFPLCRLLGDGIYKWVTWIAQLGDNVYLTLLVLHHLHNSSSYPSKSSKARTTETCKRSIEEQKIKLSLEDEETKDDEETLAVVEKTDL
ncbi:hypothetical protein LOK49_LG05G01464 [Camellia lanceoleosa]|uniref:Uncharacterized protein n=1 Tax=Camellia lanceoleosa TaxID=1840588 RepID=A0ACC0HNV0_9ERIC|nr:hypothetical protein LOK49_LG05G01464 [Camellia lanceoleosa]